MTARREMEYHGRWIAPHYYHEGQVACGVEPHTYLPLEAVMRQNKEGFTICVDGVKKDIVPGKREESVEYWVMKKVGRKRSYTKFRLIPT